MITWNLNGDIVEFEPEQHYYTVNGEKCISVTQILKHKYPSKYDGVSKTVLNAAAEKGTELHAAIEMYELFGIETNELQEFRDYLFLKNKFKFNVLAVEQPVVIRYKDLVICGQLDQVQELNGKLGIGDIKRTSVLDKNYLAYQLNLYRIGYQQSYGKEIEFLKGLHLRDGKRKYIDLPINEDMALELLEEYRKGKEND